MEKRQKDKKHRPCLACRAAISEHHKKYRNRRIMNGARSEAGQGYRLKGGEFWQDATGTVRRLRALGVMGYGWVEIGKRLGVSGSYIGTLAGWQKTNLYPETVDKIKRLYDELSMIPPEETRSVRIAKTRLGRLGYVPPLAWEDELIDDPYHLPIGLTKVALWEWYCKAATIHERIEWVLENGFPQKP